MNKTVNTFLAIVMAGLFSHSSQAEIAVVVDSSVNVDGLDMAQLERLYLDKSVRIQSSAKLIPVDQKQGSALRIEFGEKVLGKSERQLASYWSRLMFSGKGQPPRQYDNDAAVIEQVTGNPGKLGYIDAASATAATKILLRIP